MMATVHEFTRDGRSSIAAFIRVQAPSTCEAFQSPVGRDVAILQLSARLNRSDDHLQHSNLTAA